MMVSEWIRRISGVAMAAFCAGVASGQVSPPAAPVLGPSQPSGVAIGPAYATIVVGDPAIPNFPSVFDAIDGNTPDSPFAGVVSVYGALSGVTGFLGSGVAIDRTHVLTAAHVVDFLGGLTPEGNVTGDGVADAVMPTSRVYLNYLGAPDPIRISAVTMAPNWHGFRNVSAPEGISAHDDLAIVTLAEALPAEVPVYPIYRTPFDQDSGKIILMAGYGGGGNAAAGITQPASFDIKRYGWNIAALYESDDEGTGKAEQYLSDFDAPAADGSSDIAHLGFDGYGSLGNDFEAIIAPGDSGGPSFILTDLNGDGFVTADELTVFGLTTFSFDTSDGTWPHFGAGYGGPVLSAYAGWVDGVLGVPEAGTLLWMGLGALGLMRRRR